MTFALNENLEIERNSIHSFIYVIVISSALNILRWIGLSTSSIVLWSIPFICSLISLYFVQKKQTTSSVRNSIIFWMNYVAVVYVLGHATYVLATSNIGFMPFGGFKITAIVIALIAPYPLINGYLSILGCGLIPSIMYYTILRNYEARMTVQEPALTVVTAVICFLVYRYRHRGLKIEREFAKLKTEKENLDELAKIFLSLRDLTNTPIQNLMLVSTLLEENRMSAEKAVRYLNVSAQQLQLISQILSEFRLTDRTAEDFQSMYTQSDPVHYLRGRIVDLQKKVDSSFKLKMK